MKIKHIDGLQDKLNEKLNLFDIINEDNLASNSEIKLPTQKSVKTYIDNYTLTGMDSYIDIIETFNVIENKEINELFQVTLTNIPRNEFSILVFINGIQLESDKYSINSNVISISNIPYIIDTLDSIKIYYKY